MGNNFTLFPHNQNAFALTFIYKPACIIHIKRTGWEKNRFTLKTCGGRKKTLLELIAK